MATHPGFVRMLLNPGHERRGVSVYSPYDEYYGLHDVALSKPVRFVPAEDNIASLRTVNMDISPEEWERFRKVVESETNESATADNLARELLSDSNESRFKE